MGLTSLARFVTLRRAEPRTLDSLPPSRFSISIWMQSHLLGPVTHVAHAAIAVGIGSAWNSYRERQLARLEAQKNNLLERRRAKEEAV